MAKKETKKPAAVNPAETEQNEAVREMPAAEQKADNPKKPEYPKGRAVEAAIGSSKRFRKQINENPHYLHWGVTAFLVIAASMLLAFMIFNTSKIVVQVNKFLHILRPVIYGLILAYLMNPIVTKIEVSGLIPLWKKMEKDPDDPKSKKLHRGISIGVTIFALIIVIYLFFANIIPQLVQSIQTIATQFPTYGANMEEYIGKFLNKNPELQNTVNSLLDNYNSELENILNSKIMPAINDMITKVSGNLLNSVVSVLSTLWNLIIGLIISIYLLASKEHFAGQSKKVIYSMMKTERANQAIKNIRFMNHTFGDYIRGKLIDSLIIGLLCFIGMTCMTLPYALLISVIVGVTNIIPFFGPYLGAIPSALLILMVNPKQALIFIIFVLVLQQFDGNFLGPKILGESTGLSSFWILFSITLMGGYFGVAGMAVGVPVFAILYAAARSLIHKSLKNKGLSVQTKKYTTLDQIKNGEYIELSQVNKQKPETAIEEKKERKGFFHKDNGKDNGTKK